MVHWIKITAENIWYMADIIGAKNVAPQTLIKPNIR
jgi:hypothetical protein